MNLFELFHYIPRALFNSPTADFTVQSEKLHAVARSSYEICTEWFGPPADHAQGYKLIYDTRNQCVQPIGWGPYLIEIKKGYDDEQYAAVIAHEIYHRVTIKRPGIRNKWWVDEMVAYAATRQAAPLLGYPEYATYMHKRHLENPDNFTPRAIRDICSRGIPFGMNTDACRLKMEQSFIGFSMRLEALVGWDAMRKIVGCLTWEEWLSGLTPDLREQVVTYFNVLLDI